MSLSRIEVCFLSADWFTGILKGVGKNVDWSNQTWLRADTVLLASELDGLFEVYPAAKDEFKKTGADKLSIEEQFNLFRR